MPCLLPWKGREGGCRGKEEKGRKEYDLRNKNGSVRFKSTEAYERILRLQLERKLITMVNGYSLSYLILFWGLAQLAFLSLGIKCIETTHLHWTWSTGLAYSGSPPTYLGILPASNLVDIVRD